VTEDAHEDAPRGRRDGPVAIVTGASQGIGLAVARRLAGDRYQVAMVARPSPRPDAAAAEVGPAAFPVGCDVTRPADTARAVAAVVRPCGRVDALVNCASATRTGAADSFTDDEWVEAFQVKVFGALRMMRAAWPHLAAARGSVVNIGGIGARTPRDAFAMTGPLSAALLAFTKVFADRGISDGVRVNAVNPGAVLTPRTVAMLTARAEAAGRDHRRGRGQDQGPVTAGGNETGASWQRYAGSNQGSGRRWSSMRCRTASPTRPTSTRRSPGRSPCAASSPGSTP
jgi:3-oxoacyl-[acyl-carrier protein] reductase